MRATSHTRLRALDHYTPSNIIGGVGGASPSSLTHYTWGANGVWDTRWMYSLHGFLHGIKRIMFYGHLDYSQKPPLGDRPNTKSEDHGTPNAHNRRFTLFHHARQPAWIKNSLKYNHLVEGPITYDFTLHLRVRDHTTWFWTWSSDGLWTLSFGLSQFHGHGSWLVCEVAPSNAAHDKVQKEEKDGWKGHLDLSG